MRMLSFMTGAALLLGAATAQACPTYAQQGATYQFNGAQLLQPQRLTATAGGPNNLQTCPQPGVGYVSTVPTFTVYLSGMEPYALDLSVVSGCDATLLVNTADAQWRFDDDSNGNLDPRMQISGYQPLEGRVDIWVGSYDGQQCQATLSMQTTQLGGGPAQPGGKPGGAVAQPAPQPQPHPQPMPTQMASFAGTWQSNVAGTMTMTQTGTQVTGTYTCCQGGQIQGVVTGNVLQGTYIEDNGTDYGTVTFTLSADGASFTGTWARTNGQGGGGGWNATRVGTPPVVTPTQPQPAPTNMAFVGSWRVEDAADGRNQNYHPVPWQVMANGTVSAAGLWSGTWSAGPNGEIAMQIVSNGQIVDQFTVRVAPDGNSFTAYRNGRDYRYGVRNGAQQAGQNPTPQPATPAQPSPSASFVGEWSTNQGQLVITQSGGQLTGTYGTAGTLIGTQTGNRLVGTYEWSGNPGQFELTLGPSGNGFSGTWSRPGASGNWTGTRR